MMISNGASPPSCRADHCYEWSRIYLHYCLCDFKDGASLFLGTISIISWAVAEIPQIITNYRQKSTEGMSVGFLMTWIVGDLFNLIGCQLEPTTLPTQYYVALLYTVTTFILTGQTIYYGHIRHRLKEKKNKYADKDEKHRQVKEWQSSVEKKSSLSDSDPNRATHPSGVYSSTCPIPVQAIGSHESYIKDFYYTSARSLSKSPIPQVGSWLAQSHGEQTAREPLLRSSIPASAPPANLLSVVPSAVIFLGYCLLLFCMTETPDRSRNGMVLPVGRKLLQENNHEAGSSLGTFLGWSMTAIYICGRLPQIFLNIRRGNVQGLNPLMFVFALIGNSTYVASILVKSLDWSTIKPNLPWLVDAGGCVVLDAFILIQFAYYHLRKHNGTESSPA